MSTQAAFALSPAEPSYRLAYDFLAHPPSPRTRPAEPLPPTPTVRTTVRPVSRRRSSTISTISSWATQVLPGSHAYGPVIPPAPSPLSRRPSLFRSPRSARQSSTTFLAFIDSPTHTHTLDLRTPSYASAVVPLPITPRTAAPRLQSFFPSKRDKNHHADMKFTLASLQHQREDSKSAHVSPLPCTPSKKRGLMRFLRPGPRSRSALKSPGYRQVSCKLRPQSPPPSPTTATAFRIAHRKRVQYARHGALPLPLESEVELMQFTDGGSRADAIARLGASAYTDAAGVVYTDEAEAGECLPLLLSPETEPGSTDDNHSPMEDVFMFASSAPSSPLTPCTPSEPTSVTAIPRTPTSAQVPALASSPRALLSVPARAGSSIGDSGEPAYLHVAYNPSSVSSARGKARRRPAPLALPLPAPTGLRRASVIGFDDSFVPSRSAVSEASAVRDAEMGFRGLLRATRRE